MSNVSYNSRTVLRSMGIALGVLFALLLIYLVWGDNEYFEVSLTLPIMLLVLGVTFFTVGNYYESPERMTVAKTWFSGISSRGFAGWLLGIILTGFYVILYWYPSYLGLSSGDNVANTRVIALFDPLSQFLKNQPASQWFVYGTLYTLFILLFGCKFIWKYRHNRYQVIRTSSVMFFQLVFAFLLPELLQRFNMPYNDFKNMWPLNYYFFYDWNIDQMTNSGIIGLIMLIWGILMIFVVSPILTYFYGKRWYCSWVCGCGALAETAGDPFRQLSDKSDSAWKAEKWTIHLILVFVIYMTVAVLYNYFSAYPDSFIFSRSFFVLLIAVLSFSILIALHRMKNFRSLSKTALWVATAALIFMNVLLLVAHFSGSAELFFFVHGQQLAKWYGFLIGAMFSGVIGVGFYPIMGSRVWCRFGCPMAAILGFQQRFFSRFRITTNGGQCISCGNCSVYCEMGIDVREYAEKGKNIIRSSCVGCGICAEVCPRGVLKLENGEDSYEKDKQSYTFINILSE